MIKYTYTPLNLDGMKFDYFGHIEIVDRDLFTKSLIDNFEQVNLNQLMRDAQNRKEMEEIIEEATKFATKTEMME